MFFLKRKKKKLKLKLDHNTNGFIILTYNIYQASTRRNILTTQTHQDRMRQESRRLDTIRGETLSRLQQDSIIIANSKSDNRVETKRLLRRLADEDQEVKTVECFEKVGKGVIFYI